MQLSGQTFRVAAYRAQPAGRRVHLMFALIVTVMVVIIGTSIPVHAATQGVQSTWTASQIEAARAELLGGSLPRTMSNLNGVVADTFDLRDGTSITIQQARSGAGARIGAGLSPSVWITLNRTDQKALLDGGAAALGTALCAIPGVGWVACAGIVALVAIGWTYVKAHGFCPTSKPQLKIFLDTGVFGCVK